jgi:hypothetical protein
VLHIAQKPYNHYPSMTALALTFPTLCRAEGVEPFDAQLLDAWASSGAPCHGALYAARFVLSVWSGGMGRVCKPRKKDDAYRFPVETFWRCGPFDVVDASSTWDAEHRAAFVAWAKEPWWP